MIFQQRDAGIAAITQADHAGLAGELAARWGGELAHRFEPWGAMVIATRRHDDGWKEWDASPRIDPDGRPLDFITVSMTDRVDIYRRGVELVMDEGPRVALLASLHVTGLFLGRFEAEATRFIDLLQAEDRALAEEFVSEQESLQAEMRAGAGADPMPQYRLLQVFDRLSLALCIQPLDRMSRMSIGQVPLRAGEPPSSVDLWVDEGRVVLDPYPFADDGFDVSVAARGLSSSTFPDVETYRSALQRAPVEELRFSLRRP